MDRGFPRPMSDWRGVPNDISSAFMWSRNFYFTKGDQYYLYNIDLQVSRKPQPLSHWNGFPSDSVDAAFQWANDRIYFFKGSEYYRFNDNTTAVDEGYPINTAIGWLRCDSNQLVIGPTSSPTTSPAAGGDAIVKTPSMVAVLFSTIAALFYSFQ
ncbi:matrix metalloproteinase-17 [Strongylocentrotus purpuratus]|uniref:Matrix metalloproteinase n=1 Tax=Strongylocentrotus purpuratus TaxID=7668 RepID=A0A7M7NTZ4_STRPU|nr:matrix metalloproteinase-17 [Strongylocentrotus purpuratus]